MPLRNNRNSRDDKSSKTNRSYTSNKSTEKSGKKDWNPSNKNERTSFSNRDTRSSDRKTEKKDWSSSREREDNASFDKQKDQRRSYQDKPFNKTFSRDQKRSDSDKRESSSFDKQKDQRRSYSDKPFNKTFSRDQKESDPDRREPSSFNKSKDQRRSYPDKPFNKTFSRDQKRSDVDSNDRFNRKSDQRSSYSERDSNSKSYSKFNSSKRERFKQDAKPFAKEREDNGSIRLNRYIANAGICSRRKADELIQAGVVTVNGTVVTELGTKVDLAKDEIRYNGEKLTREKMIYVLLNKPKDYITTTDDPQERRTVMHLVEKASKERIYPVGRLDRNTTGLLLLTNDGSLAEKLSHPRNSIMKIYHIELNKNLTQGDFNKIGFGLELEDGFIKPDDVSYIQGASKREVGIQIHSGKNRIVRRIFESLGYDVVKLDRVIYANLTKKDLPRGRWRYLEEKEIIQLKHFIK